MSRYVFNYTPSWSEELSRPFMVSMLVYLAVFTHVPKLSPFLPELLSRTP